MPKTRENSLPREKSPKWLANTKWSFLKIAFTCLYQQLKKKKAVKNKRRLEGGKAKRKRCNSILISKKLLVKEERCEAPAVGTVWSAASHSCYHALPDTMYCTLKLWAEISPFQSTALLSDILLQPWEKCLRQQECKCDRMNSRWQMRPRPLVHVLPVAAFVPRDTIE